MKLKTITSDGTMMKAVVLVCHSFIVAVWAIKIISNHLMNVQNIAAAVSFYVACTLLNMARLENAFASTLTNISIKNISKHFPKFGLDLLCFDKKKKSDQNQILLFAALRLLIKFYNY